MTFAATHRIPVWCGGMLEAGIGRAHNIAMSTLPRFHLPGDVSASRRYWNEDIITPEVEVTPQGTINVPTSPGIGYEPRLERIESLTQTKGDSLLNAEHLRRGVRRGGLLPTSFNRT